MARELGYASPDVMLEEMTPEQFLTWRAYSIIEPFSDVRSDYHCAMICKTIWDVNRDTKKHPKPMEIEPFLLQWGKDFAAITATGPDKTQTPEERSRNLSLWMRAIAGSITPEQERLIEENAAKNRATKGWND